MKKVGLFFCILFFGGLTSQVEKKYLVEGVERKALFFWPIVKSKNIPVVFIFHGHGGNARWASRNIRFHECFPEALVIYPEGIPGVKNSRVDQEGRYNGWQMNPGDLNDRDVKFFDSLYAKLEKDPSIDLKRIYAVGHSNGSRFVNVLWKSRGKHWAALITVAGPGGLWMKEAQQKPVWISFGKNDKIVPFYLQKKASELYLKLFKINPLYAKKEKEITYYQEVTKPEMVIEIRNAGHEFPESSIPQMVEFLKRNTQ